MFPHNIIDKYWSPVKQLSSNPVAAVDETIFPFRFKRRIIEFIITDSNPEAIIAVPKNNALSTNVIVGIIPAIPPVVTNESNNGWSIFNDVRVVSMPIIVRIWFTAAESETGALPIDGNN